MKINETLEQHGWEIECESPFEIRNIKTKSFASGNHAVFSIYYNIIESEFIERIILINEAYNNKLLNDHNFIREINNTINIRAKNLNNED